MDRNVERSLAVTSTGGLYGNADALNDYRARQEALRGELQQTSTHAAHERIRKRRGQEWRHYDDLVHLERVGLEAELFVQRRDVAE